MTIRQGERRRAVQADRGECHPDHGMDQEQYRSVYPALTACPIVMTVVPGMNG